MYTRSVIKVFIRFFYLQNGSYTHYHALFLFLLLVTFQFLTEGIKDPHLAFNGVHECANIMTFPGPQLESCSPLAAGPAPGCGAPAASSSCTADTGARNTASVAAAGLPPPPPAAAANTPSGAPATPVSPALVLTGSHSVPVNENKRDCSRYSAGTGQRRVGMKDAFYLCCDAEAEPL